MCCDQTNEKYEVLMNQFKKVENEQLKANQESREKIAALEISHQNDIDSLRSGYLF